MITSSSSTSISTTSTPLPSSKISCFNTKCSGSSTNLVSSNTDNSKLLSSAESSSQNQKPQQQQQQKLGIGWRLRSGEHAQLCSRCSGIYEQGTFCDVFHLESDGWRKCQTCAKRVHCGCIVSAPMYMLLDYGGIECIGCARKTMPMTPNSMWSPSSLLSSQMLERTKEPVKSWNQLSTSFPGQWRNGHHLWNTGAQSDLQQRLSLEFDRPLHNERLITSIRPSMSISDKKVTEPSGALNLHREEDNDLLYGRRNVPSDSGSTRSALPSSSTKGDQSSLLTGLNAHFPSMNQSQNHMAPPLPKKSSRNSHNSNDAAVEAHSGRSRVDAKTRAQLLPRYWPRITDQELQQISGDTNAIITPLFEKMLSASDAGRIGRLVLPKKCAEAYFPPIFHPEGVPLKVQDAGGNEWVFQFRFWPNNNSRMYVLEGVTPCIQSMHLQAGDTVTFSRIDPEGKLVMGFRKANNGSSDQDTQTATTNNIPTPSNGSKGTGEATVNVTTTLSSQKGGTESRNLSTATDVTPLSKSDQAGIKQNDGSPIKSSQSRIRRRGNTLGSKNKRLRIESEDTMELNVTWQEAQDLLRPHPDHNPSIVVIEGHEIEEFEEAPVIGKPSIFTKDQSGDSSQWAQCENCFKWRKLPVDALLTLVWTCSKNKWDSERSSCSSAQEGSKELTYVLLHTGSTNPNNKIEPNGAEPSDGLDTLANLAILEEGNFVSSQTTKHPRHRAGCTCIVCIQPPSGKGPKHKDTCDCNVCLTVKRRFKTLMLRRERKQSEKETSSSSALLPPLPPQSAAITNVEEVEEDDNDRSLPLDSPLKAQIDLNIQPEREEEPSPKAEGTAAAAAT